MRGPPAAVLYKDGVSPTGLNWRMHYAIRYIIAEVYREHNQTLVITAAVDNNHSTWSLHPYGCAVDTRTRFFTKEELGSVVAALRERFAGCHIPGFQVVVEKTHLHIEWDYKEAGYGKSH